MGEPAERCTVADIIFNVACVEECIGIPSLCNQPSSSPGRCSVMSLEALESGLTRALRELKPFMPDGAWYRSLSQQQRVYLHADLILLMSEKNTSFLSVQMIPWYFLDFVFRFLQT